MMGQHFSNALRDYISKLSGFHLIRSQNPDYARIIAWQMAFLGALYNRIR